MKEKYSLRKLLQSGKQVIAPCVWDCMSTRALELTGYEAALVSSAAVSYGMTGLPDVGLLTADEMINIVTRIHMASPLALIIDCESGYGDSPLHAYRTVRRLALAGASAIMMSDQCGQSGVERIIYKGTWSEECWSKNTSLPREEWLAKIKASVEAVKGTDCMVIARTECWYGMGMEEAISRCEDAVKIGADMVLICGITNVEQCKQINARIPGWKMYPDIVSTNGKPDVEVSEMMENGFNLVTLHCVEKGFMWGMLEYAERTLKDRNTIWIDQKDMGDRGVFHWFTQVPQYIDFKGWLDFEKECNDKGKQINK